MADITSQSNADQRGAITRSVPPMSRMQRRLRHIMPLLLLEGIARFGGYLIGIVYPDRGLRAEERIRGILVGRRNGHGLTVLGRGVVLDSPFDVTMGRGTALRSGVKINTGSEGWCEIGPNTHISHGTLLAAAGGIRIGSHCGISSEVVVYSRTYDRSGGVTLADAPTHYAPVAIGDGVHIGAGVRILPGVTIGDHAVLGAGAVVTKDVPGATIVAGVPARKIGELDLATGDSPRQAVTG